MIILDGLNTKWTRIRKIKKLKPRAVGLGKFSYFRGILNKNGAGKLGIFSKRSRITGIDKRTQSLQPRSLATKTIIRIKVGGGKENLENKTYEGISRSNSWTSQRSLEGKEKK